MHLKTTRTASERAIDALRRVDALDRRGPGLGAVPVLNPEFLSEVGRPGRLSGRVCTVKDSFAVAGLPLAAGSPAFEGLVGAKDATVVSRIRAAGTALLGKTNMPPVAIGGGQPGLYGRTVSPFNPDFLAAAWHSGSSIGSAVSVAAGFCDFGIGEETVSSGRSPASNNGLVAYTPSWGVIPSTGNLPLHPYRDVVVPHATTVAGLSEVARCIVGDDGCDVWHRQRGVDMSAARAAIDQVREGVDEPSLEGLRFGVPFLYVGESVGDVAGIPIRPSVRAVWDAAERKLRNAGAEVTRVRFPVVESYERRTTSLASFERQGFLPKGWTDFELGPLMTCAWAGFLRTFAGGVALSDIDPSAVRPVSPWSTDVRGGALERPVRDVFDFERIFADEPMPDAEVLRVVEPAVRALNEGRRRMFDEWMDSFRLDAVIFPANGDVGLWAAEEDTSAAELAWRDGAVFSHGNHVLRRTGIPTVTIPMGVAADIGMPVGVTVAGRGWDDARLLGVAAALEKVLPPRPSPTLPEVGAGPLAHSEEIRHGATGRPQRGVDLRAVGVRQVDQIDVSVASLAGRESACVELLGRTAMTGERVRAAPDEWPRRGRPLAIAVQAGVESAAFCEIALEFYNDAVLYDGVESIEREGAG